jgi:hypothetical protein
LISVLLPLILLTDYETWVYPFDIIWDLPPLVEFMLVLAGS